MFGYLLSQKNKEIRKIRLCEAVAIKRFFIKGLSTHKEPWPLLSPSPKRISNLEISKNSTNISNLFVIFVITSFAGNQRKYQKHKGHRRLVIHIALHHISLPKNIRATLTKDTLHKRFIGTTDFVSPLI